MTHGRQLAGWSSFAAGLNVQPDIDEVYRDEELLGRLRRGELSTVRADSVSRSREEIQRELQELGFI